MRKLLYALVFSLLTLSFANSASAQQGVRSHRFTIAGPDAAINLTNTSIAYHKLTWTVSGTASVCTVALDTSSNGTTWSAGGAITGQNCTSNGSSSVVNVVANYVRMNMTALTETAGSSVTVTWDGYTSNPSGGGGVTGCSTSGGIAYENGTANTLTCSSALTTPVAGEIDQTLNGGLAAVRNISDTNSGLFVLENMNAAGGSSATRWWEQAAVEDSGDTFSEIGLNYNHKGNVLLISTVGNHTTDSSVEVNSDGNGTITLSPAAGGSGVVDLGPHTAPSYKTASNCADSAGAAACGSAAAGMFVVDAGNTTVTVSTTAAHTTSEINVHFAPYAATALGVSCNATVDLPTVTTVTDSTSFVVTVAAAPVTTAACYTYTITN